MNIFPRSIEQIFYSQVSDENKVHQILRVLKNESNENIIEADRARGPNGETIAHYLARSWPENAENYLGVLKVIDLNQQRTDNGNTPAHDAADVGALEMPEIIMAMYSYDADLTKKNAAGDDVITYMIKSLINPADFTRQLTDVKNHISEMYSENSGQATPLVSENAKLLESIRIIGKILRNKAHESLAEELIGQNNVVGVFARITEKQKCTEDDIKTISAMQKGAPSSTVVAMEGLPSSINSSRDRD